MAALARVQDPELHRDLVSLGLVEQVEIKGGAVAVRINLTTPACPLKEQIEADVRAALAGTGAQEISVVLEGQVRPRSGTLPGVKHILAIGSGKGGVGKSSVAANVAVALAQDGAQVGLLDADIYGPSQAHLFGVSGEKLKINQDKKILPLERYGISVLSVANVAPPGEAMIWRGPILHGTIRQFLQDVLWGELDYLVVDLPPGTGDVQLSLAQLTSVSGGAIVTTPQSLARIDAERALDMFHKVQIPVLGVIENMSYFTCPHCGERSAIFGEGGGQALAESAGVAFLGQVPFVPALREDSDRGIPIMASAPDSQAAQALRAVARQLAGQLSIQSMASLPMV